MRPIPVRHPTAQDLANLAGERLGKKKAARILAHCRECPECAESLLQAARDQPLPAGRPALSVWNWISIAVLLVAAAGVFVALVLLLRRTSAG